VTVEQALFFDTHAALETLWANMADDPQQRALAAARFCLDHAPHLIDWLNNKIHDSMSDLLLKTLLFGTPGPVTDGRLLAINALAEYKARHAPPQPAAALPPAKAPPQRRPPRQSAQRTAVAIFEHLFHTTLDILPSRQEQPLRIDWEMGRLAIGLSRAPQFRLWVLARDLTRRAEGSGVVTRRELWGKMRAYRIACSKRHFNRLLAAGEGLFWYPAGGQLYLRGIQPVACALTQWAQARGILTEGNAPGNREVLLDPSGCLEQWEGMLYAGWMTGREDKGKGPVTIARATLARLFGRDESTLRRWEENRLQNIVSVQPNVAQCVDEAGDLAHIPDHALPYLARIRTAEGTIHESRIMWQIPNSYHAQLPMHPHRGQASKVRRAVNSIDDPADIESGGQNRRYYPSPKALKARHRSLKFRKGLMGDVTKRVYVYLGRAPRGRRGVFEYTANAVPVTQAGERETAEKEALYFAMEGLRERQYWAARQEWLME
jgi:hypothetical protein